MLFRSSKISATLSPTAGVGASDKSIIPNGIPSRLDVGNIRVEFESSYEPTGPFGAKSIGEIVINTPSPAIASAVSHAVGVKVRELPITAEKVFWGMQEED